VGECDIAKNGYPTHFWISKKRGEEGVIDYLYKEESLIMVALWRERGKVCIVCINLRIGKMYLMG
jgi:hypothetical protein